MNEYITTLKLADDLFDGLLSGDKQVTIRLGERLIEENAPLTFESVNGTQPDVKVLVDTVVSLPINEVPHFFYEADGFTSTENMVESMKRFYPNITMDSVVTIVGYEVM